MWGAHPGDAGRPLDSDPPLSPFSGAGGDALGSPAAAAPFTAGNLVVYRVGDGTFALSPTGNKVFLDEFTPLGTLVQSIALPSDDSVNLISGPANAAGVMSRSADGRYLLIPGYNWPVGTPKNVETSGLVPRIVGRELDHARIRAWKAEALHFQLDLRRPDPVVRNVGNAAPGSRRTLPEQLEDFLAHRPPPAGIDRAAFIAEGTELPAGVARDAEER